MRCAYCHLWPNPLYNGFPHYHINGTIFEKKKGHWTQNVSFDLLYTFVRNISHSKKNWERYMFLNEYWSSCKVSVILVRFQLNLCFLERASKNTRMSSYITNIWSVGSKLFHASRRTDGQTDMKLIEAFHNFAYAPTKFSFVPVKSEMRKGMTLRHQKLCWIPPI